MTSRFLWAHLARSRAGGPCGRIRRGVGSAATGGAPTASGKWHMGDRDVNDEGHHGALGALAQTCEGVAVFLEVGAASMELLEDGTSLAAKAARLVAIGLRVVARWARGSR